VPPDRQCFQHVENMVTTEHVLVGIELLVSKNGRSMEELLNLEFSF
jgi:hypothetical protein